MCTHLTAYQSTVRTLHEQNDRNAELLGCLEAAVTEKDAEISRLRNEEMEKDLRLQAQHRDFQAQLSAEQTACAQVTNILKLMRQELEALKQNQGGPNPMDVSLTDNVDVNREWDRVAALGARCHVLFFLDFSWSWSSLSASDRRTLLQTGVLPPCLQ